MKRSDVAHIILWLLLLAIPLAGCSAVSASPAPPTPTATAIVVSEALRQDAGAMATDLGISVDEAIRRLSLQDPIGRLGAELEQREAETFVGLWIQHEPEYRVVVAFSRDGQETIKPYVENTPLAGLIEVRTASVTLAELKAAQQKAIQLVRELGLPFSSGINVQENRVELYVSDRSLFETSMQNSNLQLPEHVEVVVTYEPLDDEIPFALTPVPGLAFPQLRAQSTTFMLALLQGKLAIRDGCLRVSEGDEDPGSLIIWQPDYFLNDNDGTVEVLDREGKAVARVGERVSMGGGEVSLASVETQLRGPIPSQCEGPYWLMGEIVLDP